jgi:sialic acid synthase SpsE
MIKQITINNRTINDKCLYFVADIGANHDGSIERAFRLIELAKEAGADAAKFQNFKAERIVSAEGFASLGGIGHQKGWKKSVFETYTDASVSDAWTAQLKAKCDEVGIDYFTSPYDFEAVEHVAPYVDVYKIGSGDITWLEIIQHIGRQGKPVLIATGAADMKDVERAMSALQKVNTQIVLMQCNTNYTTDPDKFRHVNLNVLRTFSKRYPQYLLGLSDHTFGHATVCGAVALGARVIEKHFTDDNDRTGPDHKFAMTPLTWRTMVDTANQVLQALGDGVKRIEENEVDSRVVQQRSLHAKCEISAGTVISMELFESLRPCPGNALRPFELEQILGCTIKVPMIRGEQLTRAHVNASPKELT